MSQYTDTQQTPYGGFTGLSTRQRWEIAVGIIIAAALAVAAFAYVNRTESPVVEQVAQPVAQTYAGVDDLATRLAVPAQSFAGTDDLATRSAVPVQSFAGSDDSATRTVVVEAQSYAGADDLATRLAAGSSGAVAHSALDPFEERSGAVSPALVGTSGSRYAESDDLAVR